MEVRFIGRAAAYDGTLSGILMKLRKNVTCELSVPNQTLGNADHDIAVAYDNGDPVGIIAYNPKKKRVELFCAKTEEVGEKLRLALAKRNPKVREYLLGTPTFTSPPAYTSDPVMEYDRQIRTNVNLPSSAIEEEEEGQERSTNFKKTVEKPSAFFPEIKVKAGLKTRRRKHRNGSSRVRRHRSRRVSSRKVKA